MLYKKVIMMSDNDNNGRQAVLLKKAEVALRNLAAAAADRSTGGLRTQLKGLVEDLVKEGSSRFVRAVATRTLEFGRNIRQDKQQRAECQARGGGRRCQGARGRGLFPPARAHKPRLCRMD